MSAAAGSCGRNCSGMVGRYRRKNANSRTAYAHSNETSTRAALIRNDFSRTIKAPHAVSVSRLKRDDNVEVMYRPRKPGSSFAQQTLMAAMREIDCPASALDR